MLIAVHGLHDFICLGHHALSYSLLLACHKHLSCDVCFFAYLKPLITWIDTCRQSYYLDLYLWVNLLRTVFFRYRYTITDCRRVYWLELLCSYFHIFFVWNATILKILWTLGILHRYLLCSNGGKTEVSQLSDSFRSCYSNVKIIYSYVAQLSTSMQSA